MGRDKSLLVIDGTTLARRTAALLRRVCHTAIEVGPGHSGLVATREDPAGEGPLAAVAAGRRLLRHLGSQGAALVIACDLPLLNEPLLRFLADYDAPGTVLPVVEGRVQPLCARWGPGDLDAASDFLARGVRSLRHLALQPDVTLVDESAWGNVVSVEAFFDVDSPGDLDRYGLS
jgi:molybdopterin-guanine dinucleotide biosynthesis protein A